MIGISINDHKPHELVEIDGDKYWLISETVEVVPYIHLWKWQIRLPPIAERSNDSDDAGKAVPAYGV